MHSLVVSECYSRSLLAVSVNLHQMDLIAGAVVVTCDVEVVEQLHDRVDEKMHSNAPELVNVSQAVHDVVVCDYTSDENPNTLDVLADDVPFELLDALDAYLDGRLVDRHHTFRDVLVHNQDVPLVACVQLSRADDPEGNVHLDVADVVHILVSSVAEHSVSVFRLHLVAQLHNWEHPFVSRSYF
jgi:hypothetical protein